MDISKGMHPKDESYIIDYHCGDSINWKIWNKNVWHIEKYEGRDILFSSGEAFQRIYLPFQRKFISENDYCFDIRFKLKTDKRNVRFMVTDTNKKGQLSANIIWEANVPNNTWIRIREAYHSRSEGACYFMLASTDFSGLGSYVTFDWIRFWNKY